MILIQQANLYSHSICYGRHVPPSGTGGHDKFKKFAKEGQLEQFLFSRGIIFYGGEGKLP